MPLFLFFFSSPSSFSSPPSLLFLPQLFLQLHQLFLFLLFLLLLTPCRRLPLLRLRLELRLPVLRRRERRVRREARRLLLGDERVAVRLGLYAVPPLGELPRGQLVGREADEPLRGELAAEHAPAELRVVRVAQVEGQRAVLFLVARRPRAVPPRGQRALDLLRERGDGLLSALLLLLPSPRRRRFLGGGPQRRGERLDDSASRRRRPLRLFRGGETNREALAPPRRARRRCPGRALPLRRPSSSGCPGFRERRGGPAAPGREARGAAAAADADALAAAAALSPLLLLLALLPEPALALDLAVAVPGLAVAIPGLFSLSSLASSRSSSPSSLWEASTIRFVPSTGSSSSPSSGRRPRGLATLNAISLFAISLEIRARRSISLVSV